MKRFSWLKLAVLFGGLGLAAYALIPHGRRAASSPYLLPVPHRMAGVRFDPSFFYGRGLTARELASELVATWQKAGLNTILFRAYDPVYGASYRTSLPFNSETDYGRQDLLRWILCEAHNRDMKVYAWLTMLNHAGAWEARKAWRALRSSGEPYKASSLPAPLCPRQPEVREWWLRFVDDLLEHYPQLDGLDLAEPVLSWRETEACYCELCSGGFQGKPPGMWSEYRAGPITDLALETFRRARARGKETMLTTVLPADAGGSPLPFAGIRDQTGLDLERLLSSQERPQYLSAEVMWQEWAGVYDKRDVFEPGWARRAITEVRQRVAGRSVVIAHLELGDSGQVQVSAQDLKASLTAALEGGAQGFEVYDAALLEKKVAWDELQGLYLVHPRKKVLILHEPEGESDAWQLATLCGHFAANVTVKQVASYHPGEARSHDALFYIGLTQGSEPGEAFLQDVETTQAPVLWLNAHIQSLLERTARFGFSYVQSAADASYGAVSYKGTLLVRREPHLNIVRVTDPANVQVLAEARSEKVSAPYVLRSGQLWYFADNPLSYASEGGAYVVLADLLHDVLGQDHVGQKQALVRLEDVHPLTPPEDIRAAARLLHDRGIPFLVSLVPFYCFPEKGEFSSLDEKPEFVEALREAVKLGGTVVLHGVTHQRTGESTADYELWDAEKKGPPADRSDAKTRARLFRGLEECYRHGIYPLLWETPHYAAPLSDYKVISQVFSAAIERRQTADRIGTDQLYPYVILSDRFGQLVLPENLGFIPLESQKPDPILTAARRTTVVRDATVCFFFHLFCDIQVLKKIVDGLLDQGFSFPDVRSLPLTVTGPNFSWSTTKAPLPADPRGTEGKLLDQRGEEIWRGPASAFSCKDEPPIGMRIFLPKDAASTTKPSPLPGMRGEEGLLLKPLQVGIFASEEEAAGISATFRAVASPCRLLDAEDELAALPKDLTLIVLTEASAQSIGPALGLRLKKFLEEGGVLLTWGSAAMAQELGIQFSEEEREVAAVVYLDYPDVATSLRPPRRVMVPTFDRGAEILAEEKEGHLPLFGALQVGEGMLLYSALPPFGSGAEGPYPYLLSALQDHARLAPVCRSKNLEVYYDYSQRQEPMPANAVENLVKRWSRSGVRVIHAAAWHEYPPSIGSPKEWTYEYDQLIRLAHQNAMLVYAWISLPLVSEKFWTAHPEWREKNPRGADVKIGWREAVSLLDPACREEVKRWLARFLERFDFDGVNLVGLSFGGETFEKPETLSPFSEAARQDFQEQHGFDPRDLWKEGATHFWKTSREDLKTFLAWRKLWTTRLHREFLDFLSRLPAASPRVLVVSLPDAAARPSAAELLGVDVAEVLKLRKEFKFRVQIMDAGEMRPWGEERWKGILRDYGQAVDPSDLVLTMDLTQEPGTGTWDRTGIPLYMLLASARQLPVAIYSEDSIPDADWPFLAPALASEASLELGPDQAVVSSPQSIRLSLETRKGLSILLGGKPWQGIGREGILVPPGEHRLEFSRRWGDSTTRITDASCAILEAQPISRGVRFTYESRERALVVLSKDAVEVTLDGQRADNIVLAGERGRSLLCPPGRHQVTAVTEKWSEFAVRVSSVGLSVGIVAVSGVVLGLVVFLFLWARVCHKSLGLSEQPK